MESRNRQKKILIVGEEPEGRAVLRKRLSAEGFQVLEAADGPSSVRGVRKERPDLIILDLVMAGQNGIEIYHALRQDPGMKSIPIIFLTALTPSNTVAVQSLQLLSSTQQGLELQKSGMILTKPYRPQSLLEEIRHLFSGDGKRDAQGNE